MNKHYFTVAFSAAVALSGNLWAQDAGKPNIVILYADDMGYGDLGANNPVSKIPTPNLDRLAATGMRFTDAHSSSGICSPSRYALLTGTHHWRRFHGIVNSFGKPVFKDGELTLPAMLREKGYDTACIGKWHLGWNWDAIRQPDAPKERNSYTDFDWSKPVPGGPLDRGFDHYFGDDVINFPPYAWIEDNRLLRAPDSNLNMKNITNPAKEGHWEARSGPALKDWDFYKVLPTLTEKSVEYIRSRKDSKKPFFLYVPFPSPHAPIIPNDEFNGKSKAGPYGDFVVQTDAACGRILAALKEIGATENTIVIFSADNGAEKYAYARDEKYGHWSSRPFRGLKRDIYEGGHHVPFIIRWPGVTKPGTVSEALISQVDLMATIAAQTCSALPADAALDSHDFLPFLTGKTETAPRRSHVHNTSKNHYAIRDGKWLLVDAKTGYVSGANKEWEKRHGYVADDESPVELYDMQTDPEQKHNVASKHPEQVKTMQALLKKLREQGYSAPRLTQEKAAMPTSQPRAQSNEDVKAEHAAIGIDSKYSPIPSHKRTQHPEAQWFPDAGLGLFLHWDPAAILANGISWPMLANHKLRGKKITTTEFERIVREQDFNLDGTKTNIITPNEYWTLAKDFNPDNYHPEVWLKMAKEAGFTYAVLTTKHHAGFALWPSAYGDYNTKNYMNGRDLVKEYVEACRKVGLKVGLYFSGPDWHFDRDHFNFLYWRAAKLNPHLPQLDADLQIRNITHTPEQIEAHQQAYAALVRGQVEELLSNYGKIDLIWFDGRPSIPEPNRTNAISQERIRELQPGIIINNRMHGKGDYITPERHLADNLKLKSDEWGELCSHWNHWSYNKTPFRPLNAILTELVRSRNAGVNYLLGFGPMPNGDWAPEAYENVAKLGEWMKINGEAVYGTRALATGENASVPASAKGDVRYLYLIPATDSADPTAITMNGLSAKPASVILLSDGKPIDYTYQDGKVTVRIPKERASKLVDVIKINLSGSDHG